MEDFFKGGGLNSELFPLPPQLLNFGKEKGVSEF